jgi:hypothetical protein
MVWSTAHTFEMLTACPPWELDYCETQWFSTESARERERERERDSPSIHVAYFLYYLSTTCMHGYKLID